MVQTAILSLLLVEDSASDASLFMRHVQRSSLTHNVAWVKTGEHALMYLRREGEYGQVSSPNLVVLDLNLPGLHGQSVLAIIKSDPLLRQIPVIVFTSSDKEADICRAYDLYANCYLTKPTRIQNYTSTLEAIEKFWLSLAVLPPRQLAT